MDDATTILECVSIGVVVIDAEGVIEWLNHEASAMLRLSAKSGIGLYSCFEEGDERLWSLAKRLAESKGERVTVRGVRVLPLERGVTVDLAASALVTEEAGSSSGGGESDGFERDRRYVVTMMDVTARAGAETEAARLRQRLAESETARAKLSTLQAQLVQTDDQPVMVGASASLGRVRAQVARVATTDTTVLIQGETGSGKELVARSIHAESPRARSAFVAVNCAALPESLIESELFGHERGAFTGADRRRLGKFELADGGTLFLDEIAELPLAAQAKLLRVLQGGAFERVGGTEPVSVDVRVVAATHRDLARRVERSLFREDLYYRLNVFRIDVPPLRERREDLRELVEYLHTRVAKRLARAILPLSERSVRRIMAYRWPGNIRELANAVERATLLADGPELEIELPEAPAPVAAGEGAVTRGSGAGTPTGHLRDVLLDLTLEQLQRLHIMHTLESCDYHVFGENGAAEKLDINPQTLLSRMDKYGIPRPRTMRAAKDQLKGSR